MGVRMSRQSPRSAVRAFVGPPLSVLPVVLLVVLFGAAVVLAQVAPSRVTTGIYQVVVWEGADHVTIPTESLSCRRTDDTATCTAPVGQDLLAVELTYTGSVDLGPCAARYGDRPVTCQRQLGFYGHSSHTVWIPDGLGLTEAQRSELRDAVPWWRVESVLWRVVQTLVGTLALAAGALTFLLHRRVRPVTPHRRSRLVAGTAALGLGLFAVGGLVLGGNSLYVLSLFSMLAVATLAFWQWHLSGTPRGGRVLLAIISVVSVSVYATVALVVFLMQSGFID